MFCTSSSTWDDKQSYAVHQIFGAIRASSNITCWCEQRWQSSNSLFTSGRLQHCSWAISAEDFNDFWILGPAPCQVLVATCMSTLRHFFWCGIAWHRATQICANLQPLHFGRFQVVQPAGGATAHLSNPCEWGDFALATGGAWQGLRKHDFLPGRCVQTEDPKT